MANRFLSRNKNNDDDDLLQRQLSALGGSEEPSEEVELAAEPQKVPSVPAASPEAGEKSVLRKGIVVTGSISSVTSLYVYGTVNGDVLCDDSVTVDGTVDGNVKAASVQVLSGHIKGDVVCKNTVTVAKGSVIQGNITAEALSCDGAIDGTSTVGSKASIGENAAIVGDIFCDKVSIREGAAIKGRIQTDASGAPEEKPKAKKETADDEMGIVTDLKKYI